MEQLIKSGKGLAALMLLLTFTVAACSTTGMMRSEDVQSSLEKVDNDIKSSVVQVNAIGTSLDELTRPGQADVKRAFELFSDNVSEIKKMQNDFSKHADEMSSNIKTYLDAWDKNNNQYENPELQQSSDERREALGRTYDEIARNNIGVKEAFRSFVSDVTQIEAYLSNDLTTKGITSITSLVDKTLRNGDRLKNELENLQSAVENARAEMTQSGVTMN
ncbi:hypothetical protein [Rhodohalobacter sp.]|uniref:hypothetical protein n=1 Tax=Rhodohalobacter sp. TaxID=1974210 RepID=UPI002ACD9DF8|nr:hypothetical protein [Rhodohalobacter sp.]MDZ7755789.1 hypothetical protein [Rhodohalobacter sp.]